MSFSGIPPIRLLGRIAPLLLVVFLTACVASSPPSPPQVISHVTRFADFEGPLAGSSFAFVPLAHQGQSAEFNQYRRELAERLVAQGMVAAASQEAADYLVTFDYTSSAYEESHVVEEYGTVIPGRTIDTTELQYNYVTGAFEPYETTQYLPSVQGVTGYRTETRTVHDGRFVLRMFDLARSAGDDLYPAYEGTVVSSGSTPSFAAVSTCLFDALFSNFLQPGTQDTTQPSTTCLR